MPDFKEEFAKGIDRGILELFETIGINTAVWSGHARGRMKLPIRMKGCGLRETEDRPHEQFVGDMLRSTITLMDRMEGQLSYS